MKNIEEFKKYYFENKENFEKGSRFIENNKQWEKFQSEFPYEKFGELSLENYAQGNGNKRALCRLLEHGEYGGVGPGIGGSTAYKYGIFYSKDKNAYVTRKDIPDNPENAWQSIRTDLISVLDSVKNANEVTDIRDDYESLKGMAMFIVKLASCYFPYKVVTIAGKKHLKAILKLFDIPFEDDISSLKMAFLLNKEIRKAIPEISNDHFMTVGYLIWDFYLENSSDSQEKEVLDKKYWIYSPGENASLWDEFYDQGIMALGWDEIGDLSQYTSKSDIKEALSEYDDSDTSKKNDVLANWEFSKVLKKGDIIYAKRGMDLIIGKGIVESDYIFDDSRDRLKSIRRVNWISNKEINFTDVVGHRMTQKTLTNITKYGDYKKIESQYNEEIKEVEGSYTKDDFLDEVLMTEEQYDKVVETLERKKNIILQGVPGVGKTFCAKKLMYSLMNEKNDSRIKTVQFHQSYSYEDFVQGYRPNKDGKFFLKNGIFYELVNEAREEYERASSQGEEPKKFCIIIDEINRGNLSKVFGELMMLIESDKRDAKWGVQLTYSEDDTDEDFYIPENLYIIGTMNTADRSLAMIDYALRRRFAFVDLKPAFNDDKTCEKLRNHLVEKEAMENDIADKIISKYRELNRFITDKLGEEFNIGHSYFINQFKDKEVEEYADTYNNIVEYEILPLLDEYFFDDKEKVEEAKKIIENIL